MSFETFDHFNVLARSTDGGQNTVKSLVTLCCESIVETLSLVPDKQDEPGMCCSGLRELDFLWRIRFCEFVVKMGFLT